jgi:hypothetical protein
METKELFEFQLKNNNPLTEESLEAIELKTYFNGEEKKVGDVVLYAMVVGDIIEKEGHINELPMELITLNERHFNQFTPFKQVHQKYGSESIPVIKYR